jgi:hypothetical protein
VQAVEDDLQGALPLPVGALEPERLAAGAFRPRHRLRDLRTGATTVPAFSDGLRLHKLLDTIRRAAETGTRQTGR